MLPWMLKLVSSNIPGCVGSSAACHPVTLAPQSSNPCLNVLPCHSSSLVCVCICDYLLVPAVQHCFLMFFDVFWHLPPGLALAVTLQMHQCMVQQVLQILAELQALGKSPECARSIAASDRFIGPCIYLSFSLWVGLSQLPIDSSFCRRTPPNQERSFQCKG